MLENYRVDYKKLQSFCAQLFCAHGLNEQDGKDFAEAIVDADLSGVKSHGMVRIKTYLTQIAAGQLDMQALAEVIEETPVTALMDGHNGLGMVASARAVNKAIAMADQNYIGTVVLRGANHFGTAGYWATKLAGTDKIGVAVSNTTPILSAPGGTQRAIGSNPYSIAIPAGKYGHLCLDVSNGIMAMGKIYEYQRLNKPLPDGAWLDANGNPTTDPHANEAPDFIMRPVGAHKGFGMAVVLEALTSILGNGTYCPRSKLIPDQPDRRPSLTQTYFAVRVDAFRDLDEFTAGVEAFVEYLHSLKTQDENSKIFYPGEIEFLNRKKGKENGIILTSDIVDYLTSTAKEAGIEPKGIFVKAD